MHHFSLRAITFQYLIKISNIISLFCSCIFTGICGADPFLQKFHCENAQCCPTHPKEIENISNKYYIECIFVRSHQVKRASWGTLCMERRAPPSRHWSQEKPFRDSHYTSHERFSFHSSIILGFPSINNFMSSLPINVHSHSPCLED